MHNSVNLTRLLVRVHTAAIMYVLLRLPEKNYYDTSALLTAKSTYTTITFIIFKCIII